MNSDYVERDGPATELPGLLWPDEMDQYFEGQPGYNAEATESFDQFHPCWVVYDTVHCRDPVDQVWEFYAWPLELKESKREPPPQPETEAPPACIGVTLLMVVALVVVWMLDRRG